MKSHKRETNVLICGVCGLPVGSRDQFVYTWDHSLPEQVLNMHVVVKCCGAYKPIDFFVN